VSKFSLETHSIRIHPILWKWAKEDAPIQGYEEGGASALISGLILYNHALRNRRHWLTADLVRDLDKLESVMKEIEEHNPLESETTWIEHRLEEVFAAMRGTPPPPKQETE
jgi:hypothetical protein